MLSDEIQQYMLWRLFAQTRSSNILRTVSDFNTDGCVDLDPSTPRKILAVVYMIWLMSPLHKHRLMKAISKRSKFNYQQGWVHLPFDEDIRYAVNLHRACVKRRQLNFNISYSKCALLFALVSSCLGTRHAMIPVIAEGLHNWNGFKPYNHESVNCAARLLLYVS